MNKRDIDLIRALQKGEIFLTERPFHEAARLLEAAQAQIAQDVRRARSELRAEVGALSIQIAERLIRKSLQDDDHRRLVQEALSRIEPS